MSRKGLRTETSIVVETAQCFSTHHVALLVGYGAHAICPYLAFETCRQWRASSRCPACLSYCILSTAINPLDYMTGDVAKLHWTFVHNIGN